jgi:hypothetical protein
MNEINQKGFKVHCRSCNVELTDDNWTKGWQKYDRNQCKECSKVYNDSSNETRMWVNGRYIPKTHPLHKAGRYKSFGDAAFSSLQKDKKVKEGYVYAIVNPAWPDWIKIGMAIDADDRLNGYQTSSPMRDYALVYSVFSNNRSKDERKAHKLAGKIAERRGEWFKIPQDKAIKILKELSDG